VTKASKAAGINRVTAYKRRDQSRRFAAAWDRRRFIDKAPVGQGAMSRAVHGERKIEVGDGNHVTETRTYRPGLIIHLLKANLPARYTITAWRKGVSRDGFQDNGYRAWFKLQSLTSVPHDEKRPRWALRFLDVLRETGSVLDACKVVGVNTSTAHRARVRAPVFAAHWDLIIAEWCDDLEATAADLATNGWKDLVFRDGDLVRVRTRYSSTLAIFMLKAVCGMDDGSVGRS
jgi:hypothetical protein